MLYWMNVQEWHCLRQLCWRHIKMMTHQCYGIHEWRRLSDNTVPAFLEKGRKSLWRTWESFGDIGQILQTLQNGSDELSGDANKMLEHFILMLAARRNLQKKIFLQQWLHFCSKQKGLSTKVDMFGEMCSIACQIFNLHHYGNVRKLYGWLSLTVNNITKCVFSMFQTKRSWLPEML